MRRQHVHLVLLVVAIAGCAQPPPSLEGARDADAGIEGLTHVWSGERALMASEGRVAAPAGEEGPQLHRCAGVQGVVGYTVTNLTPGRPFAVVATDARAEDQDLDIIFYRATPTCLSGPEASQRHSNGWGDEAGFVPHDARAAIVWLFAGGQATFRYSEFAPTPPATITLPRVDTIGFRMVRPAAATSTYADMYEPHVVVAGTGTIYVAGHTMASNTHHSPAYFSRDDGATWSILPDPEPLPAATAGIPALGGRVGQGNEGGITADATGRAWLYDAAFVAGAAPLYGWCDDGERACLFDPAALDYAAFATTGCAGTAGARAMDKPWASYGNGKLLLANVGLPTGFVNEFRASSMLGVYDPDTGAREWNVCVAIGGMPGVSSMRDADGMIALPQVQRSPEGEGWMVVHHGPAVDELETSPPIVRAHRSWHPCQIFNGYGDFSGDGTYYLATATDVGQLAVSGTRDLVSFATQTFDVGGVIRYMWLSGNPSGAGALLTWGVAPDCDAMGPVSFYAAHVAATVDGLAIGNVSLVAGEVSGTCGHYLGNDVGPDGRAYLVVHASPGGCLGLWPEYVPATHVPWRVYIQDAGPTLT